MVQPSLTVKLEGVHGGKWDEEDVPWPDTGVEIEVDIVEDMTNPEEVD